MNELERHITKLLLSNDCVIVPGFGGFMAHHRDAWYDEESRMFYPPTRTIGFNPQLTMNDSLLIQSYVDVYDISYPEAAVRIENEVDELKKKIQIDKFYELNGIGTISIGSNGMYEFRPCEAGLLTPGLYGLSSFEIDSLPVVNSHIINVSGQLQSAISYLDRDNNYECDETSTPASNRNTVHFGISVFRMLAAACIAVMVFMLLPQPINNRSDRNAASSAIDTNLLYRILPKEQTTGFPDAKVIAASHRKAINVASNAKIEKSSVEGQGHKGLTSKKNYSIVLASKVTKRNAASYVERLHHQGYVQASVDVRNGSTKVIYGKYSTIMEARTQMDSLKSNGSFSDSWIISIAE